MANTIEYAKVFQNELDKQICEGSTSGWMEDNAARVIYNGGSEIKMPKSGGIEIKFFDRLKALEKLKEISHSSSGDSALPFYDALERSAAAVRERDDG